MSKADQVRFMQDASEAVGCQPIDFNKLSEDSPAYLQVFSKSDAKPAKFKKARCYKRGDILEFGKCETTTDPKAELRNNGDMVAGKGGLKNNKPRRFLVYDIDYTTNTASGLEIGTAQGLGMDSVRHKSRRAKYHVIRQKGQRNNDLVRLSNGEYRIRNRTGNPALTLKDVPPGVRWSSLSHLDPMVRVSVRITEDTLFLGRIIEKDLVRLLDIRAATATALAAHARKLLLASAAPADEVTDDDSIADVSGDDFEEPSESTLKAKFARDMDRKRKRKSTSSLEGPQSDTEVPAAKRPSRWD